ncbi:type I restriction enzyme, S subunit [Gillisia sp. Hel1_33_143]|uniref:restriction endonuclease subunit S n=1 Tax=Gillisia sp. Hel1_33_143 TaxID=1336796 RepID=UPI00087938CD|nr:restriction endonuclease subunit S [Gillisia sp. Hel1_33_143]SDS75948.1 type I restriction enzyme, S subunit [Gillisia sp. Hel1_33_143]
MESIKIKSPELRFPEFEDLWKTKKYGELFNFHSTNSFSRDLLNYDKGEVYNIHYGDIHTKFSSLFNLEKENLPFINSEINLSNIQSESYCKEGDLVIADASEDYNDIGKTIEIIGLNNQKVLAGLHTFLARPKNGNIGNGFFGYLVKTWFVRKQVMTIAQGSKVMGLSSKRLAKIDLPIPIIHEQQKIATFLSFVDKKIDQLHKKKELLENYKKGMMQNIFKQEIRFKDKNGKDFPKWVEKSLGQISKNIGYGIGASATTYDGKNKYLRITDIDEHTNKFKPKPLTSPEGNIDKRYYLKENDLLFARTGASVGKTYIYSNDDGKLVYAGFLIKFSIINQNSKFIFYVTLTRRYQNWIEVMSVRSGQPGINAEELKSFKLKLPCIEEQNKIADFLSAIDDKIDLVATEIDKTSQFKKGLLQQMFV